MSTSIVAQRRREGASIALILVLLASGVPATAEWRLEKLSTWGGAVNAVEVNPPYIYMGSGVRVLILKEGAFGTLQQIGALELSDVVYDLDYDNGLLYVIDGVVESTVTIVDVSVPSSPVALGSAFESHGWYRAIDVEGPAAYCCGDDRRGIDVYDVSNAQAPFKVLNEWDAGQLWTLWDLTVVDGYLYGSDTDDDELVIAEVTSPFNPVYQGKLTGFVNVKGLTVDGSYAYVTQGAYPGLVVVDVSVPTAAVRMGDYSGSVGIDVAVFGNNAYLAAQDIEGFRVIDVSDPASLTELGFLNDPGSVEHVTSVGTTAYLGDAGEGLMIVDCSDPADPRRVGNFDSPGRLQNRFTVDQDPVYLCDAFVGVTMLDVSDPYDPQYAGQYVSEHVPTGEIRGHGASEIILRDGLGYLACRNEGLRILDLSDPASPELLGQIWSTIDQGYGLALKDDLAYMGFNLDHFWMIDVSTPEEPTLVTKSTTLIAYADSVVIDGDVIYLGSWGVDWQIGNIADPFNTFQLSRQQHDVPQLVKRGDLLYAALREQQGWEPGLMIFDVSDSANPIEVNQFVTSDAAWGLAFHGDFLLLASDPYMHLLDVSDPSNIIEILRYDGRPGFSNETVASDGRFVYLGGGLYPDDPGVFILSLFQPGDYDSDDDVDFLDFGRFQSCYGWSAGEGDRFECMVFDFDDDDVDADDFINFGGRYTGPEGIPN